MRAKKKPVKKRATKHNFRSKLEEWVWSFLPKRRTEYETLRLPYSLHRNYVPDFIVHRRGAPDLIIEVKGYLSSDDRAKMIAVKRDNPTLDIRFIFSRDNYLNKRSKTKYSDWCIKNKFPYAVNRVPKEWMEKNG
tara:strand:- start:80 stop:484 length:405 start_codon:yes stop_codon:yes gene_type:complete